MKACQAVGADFVLMIASEALAYMHEISNSFLTCILSFMHNIHYYFMHILYAPINMGVHLQKVINGDLSNI